MVVRRLLRDVWALVRDLPDALARWLDRQTAWAHEPEMVPADDLAVWPNGEEPWCLRCDAEWPCDVFVRVSDRLADDIRHNST